MKTVIPVFLPLLLISTAAFSQNRSPSSHGYVFAAPGVSSPGGSGYGHFGGGGEAIFRGAGIGAEIGYAAAWRSFANGLGIFSANGSYHLTAGSVSPFVTGGYTLFFRSATANGFNFGGGLNYWFRPRVGLRLEVRDHVLNGEVHLIDFRIGLAFRPK